MRIISEKSTINGDEKKSCLEIEGTKEEIEVLKSAMLGVTWVRANGRNKIVEHKYHKDMPPPRTPDPMLWDIWGPQTQRGEYIQNVHPKRGNRKRFYPNVYVQHIGGFGGTKQYERNFEILTESGFSCLRSRRGKDGQYWEIWLLSDAIFADGPLKEYLIERKGKKKKDPDSEEIIQWLWGLGPGEIMVDGQHWGLSID